MKRSIVAFVIISMLWSSIAIADPVRLCPECIVYRIKKGKIAPEDGWLYTDLSQATLLATIDSDKEQLQNDFEHRIKMQAIDLRFSTATTAAALSSLRQQKKETDKIRDDRIISLEDQLIKEGEGTDKMVWFSVGVGGGILISLLSAWAYSMVAKAQSD